MDGTTEGGSGARLDKDCKMARPVGGTILSGLAACIQLRSMPLVAGNGLLDSEILLSLLAPSTSPTRRSFGSASWSGTIFQTISWTKGFSSLLIIGPGILLIQGASGKPLNRRDCRFTIRHLLADFIQGVPGRLADDSTGSPQVKQLRAFCLAAKNHLTASI